jgi:uncharacterized protein
MALVCAGSAAWIAAAVLIAARACGMVGAGRRSPACTARRSIEQKLRTGMPGRGATMLRTRRAFLEWLGLAVAVGATGLLPARAGAAEEPAFPVSPLTIETARGRYQFMVELAETPSTWRQGLQKRQHLAAYAGMLFNYHEPRVVSMWMKDTPISLDMLFIDTRGVVVQVTENTVPFSLASISSGGAVLAVLELNAGIAARLGIRPGDRVVHAIFAPH